MLLDTSESLLGEPLIRGVLLLSGPEAPTPALHLFTHSAPDFSCFGFFVVDFFAFIPFYSCNDRDRENRAAPCDTPRNYTNLNAP